MKHSLRKSLLSLLLILCVFVSCLSPVWAATGPLVSNQGQRHVLCTDLSQQALDYYTGENTYENLSLLQGRDAPTDSWAATQNNALYTALQTLMTETHTVSAIYEGYAEGSLASFWPKTDAVAGSKSYYYFYSDINRSDISATMNREHVWPKANASYSQLGGGADLHHLRPSIDTVNKAKSDYTFGDIDDNAYGRTTSLINGQLVLEILKSKNLVEVRDNIKGDIARILLYVYCRWGQPNLYSNVTGSKLPALDEDDSVNNGVRAIEDLDTLLRWCREDPVDQWEMGRNDQSENIQGNRNVFIDYPEFAWLIFGQTPPEDMSTPSGMAANPHFLVQVSVNNPSYGTATISSGIITATPKNGYMVGGYTLVSGQATVTREGNRFYVTPSTSCHIRIMFVPRTFVYLDFSDGTTLSGFAEESVTLPQAPDGPEGYSFVGWSLDTVKDSPTAPTYYAPGTEYVLTEDQYLYAVYSHELQAEVSDGDYVKLTQEPENWSGDYLIVYESYGYIFNGSLTNPNVNTNCRMLAISNKTIPYSSGNNFRVTVSGEGQEYSIRTASGIYIGNTSGYTGLVYGTADNYSNRLSMNADGTVTITSASGAIFGFLNSQRKFQYFNTTATNRLAVTLYQKQTTRMIPHYTTELPKGCSHKNLVTVNAVAPTCTTEGCSAYYTCADCKLSFSDKACTKVVDPAALILPATDHSYSYTEEGDSHLRRCTRCGSTVTESHSYVDGLCVCGKADAPAVIVDNNVVIRHTLNLASDISINYAISTAQLQGYDSFSLTCLIPQYENNSLKEVTEVILQPELRGSYYYFTLTGITAVSLADTIEATLYMSKKGESYCSVTDIYSVADYAYSQLDKDSASLALKTLCSNLLRYGASAQLFKEYRTDALADQKMTDIHRSYLCDLETVEFGTTNTVLSDLSSPSVTWAGKSLNLESKVILCFIMDLSKYSGDPKELSLHVSYTDYEGVEQTLILTDPVLYNSANSYYSYNFDGLLAAELRSEVSVAVYRGDSRVSQTLVYSAATYGGNKSGQLRTLCQALLAYSDAALAQFTS